MLSDSDNDYDELREEPTQEISSSDVGSSSDDADAPPKKLRGKGVNYALTANRQMFDSNDEFEAWMAADGKDWRSKVKRTTKKWHVEEYRCRYGAWQKNGYNCGATMRVRRPHDANIVIAEVGDRAHDHSAADAEQASALSDDVKKFSPANVPKISPSLFKEAEKLKSEGRLTKQVDGGDLYLISNTEKELEFSVLSNLFAALEELDFNDWHTYKKVKQRLAFVSPSDVWPETVYVCTCSTPHKALSFDH